MDTPAEKCSFALGRGEYCEGETLRPLSHDYRCPYFQEGKTNA